MKILIIGSDINAKLLAQYIKLQNKEADIYVTPMDSSFEGVYTAVNIRENNILELCDFVKYNQIEFTIVTSAIAVINGIAEEFKKEGFPVFAPTSESARITFFNSIANKIMYKLKIPTPKFGIFDRENLAIEYVRHSKLPVVVENDFTLLIKERNIYNTFSKARLGIQKTFENSNDKVIIKNYIDVPELYLYFITDGYNVLPLISLYKNEEDGISEIISPSDKISDSFVIAILKRIIYPLLDDISKFADSYKGILGLRIKIQKSNLYVLEFLNRFQDYDVLPFMSLLSDDLLKILCDTVDNSLSKNRDYVNFRDENSYTLVVDKKHIVNYGEAEDYIIEAEDENNYIFTVVSPTINRAKEKIYEYLFDICDDKIKSIINKKRTELF